MELTLIQKIAVWAIPVLFAISLHEVAHGWVASWCGDQTARLSGRLSLNPLKHIDLVGTVIVPLILLLLSDFIFGWAKPVPIDPRNFRKPRRDIALVAAAGPLSNFLMALFWAGISKVGLMWLEQGQNDWFGVPLIYMGGAGVMINVALCVLNLIPLPPLDGGKILSSVLPRKAAYYMHFIEPYSFLILVLLLMTGALNYIMGPPVFFLIRLISSLFGIA